MPPTSTRPPGNDRAEPTATDHAGAVAPADAGRDDHAGRARAAALPAAERRAAIIAATVPLLQVHGTGISTRQIAEAAGIAEGTIFRVFPDKESVIGAAIEAAFDPAPAESALDAIDLAMPLADRLTAAVEILQHRVTNIWKLMTAVGMTHTPGDRRGPPTLASLAALFVPDREILRRDPMACAQLLRGLTFASSHPALIVDEPLPAAEIVSLLLDGVRIAPAPPADPLTDTQEDQC